MFIYSQLLDVYGQINRCRKTFFPFFVIIKNCTHNCTIKYDHSQKHDTKSYITLKSANYVSICTFNVFATVGLNLNVNFGMMVTSFLGLINKSSC